MTIVIFTAPVIVAVKFKIPLIIWGETEWDIAECILRKI